MAKPKITVSYNGAVIGKRTTDRKYTHAVIATDFNEAAFRDLKEHEWQRGRTFRDDSFAHCFEAKEPTYRYASVITDEQRARYAATAAAGREAYEDECRQRHQGHVERDVAGHRDPAVLSYHGSAALAHSGASKADYISKYCAIRIVPVDGSDR